MRSIDAIEKITVEHPEYLKRYKQDLIQLIDTAEENIVKWHLAMLIRRISLSEDELGEMYDRMYQ